MIVTKKQLQQLIDEEFSRAVSKRRRALREAPGDQDQDGYDDFGAEHFEDEKDRHQKEADDQDKQLPPELDERRRGAGGGALFEIEAYELLQFAKAYAGLGSAVQDQLDTILDGNERDFPAETNSNAIQMIQDELGGMNEEIDTAIEAYNDWWESKGKMGDDDDGFDDEEETAANVAGSAAARRLR